MAKRKRRAFTNEFKAETVRLVRDSGTAIAEVTRELNLTDSAARGPNSAEGARHPKKATAFFATESA